MDRRGSMDRDRGSHPIPEDKPRFIFFERVFKMLIYV
jgi:hypothetical protein